MPSKTIKAMLADINQTDADGGGLWLPNIQRLFVWNEDQIAMVFDSIMRQYPLSSMLIWKTKEPVRRRKFIDQFLSRKTDLKSLYQNEDTKKITKRLVLDGQQRLQSLFIGLKGAIDGKTLQFDLLSGTGETIEESKYQFKFRGEPAIWPWVRFADLIYTKKLAEELASDLCSGAGIEVNQDHRKLVTKNIGRAKREFEIAEAIIYQEIDGTDEDNSYLFDDVVEIFIRANSGGTKLSKSDLMFTLLTTQWDVADTEMEDFLEQLNDNDRFAFTRDFVIKTAMSLLGYGAKYDVDKLRKEEVRKNIADNWKKITEAISFVRDQMVDKTFIRSYKALTSQNALIPLVYFRYHYPEIWGQGRFLKPYLIKVLLAGAFSGRPDALIDKLAANIKKNSEFDFKKVVETIEADGRNLKISADSLLYDIGYGTGYIHTLFNLWYDISYKPAFVGNNLQVDHIFAQSLLKEEKVKSETSNRMVQKYNSWEINQLANCMLLTAKENGAGDKSDTPLHEWLKDKEEDFLTLHCIPAKKSLWKIENYAEFVDARQKLILARFTDLLNDEDD